MDEPGSDTGDFVCGNRRTDTAAAQRDPARNVSRGNRSGERDNVIWVVVSVLGVIGSEVGELVTGVTQKSRYLLLAYLPMGRNAVYNALKRQAIKNIRVGQKILITKAALREFLGGIVE